VLYVLDTDTVSVIQRNNTTVIAHLQRIAVSGDEVTMTIVSVQEQFEGRLGFLRKAGATQLVDAYRYFIDTLTLFHSYFPDHVLPYDSAAQAQDSILVWKIQAGKVDGPAHRRHRHRT